MSLQSRPEAAKTETGAPEIAEEDGVCGDQERAPTVLMHGGAHIEARVLPRSDVLRRCCGSTNPPACFSWPYDTTHRTACVERTRYFFKGAAGVPVPHWRDQNVHVCGPNNHSRGAHCYLMARAWRTSCSAPGRCACHSRWWKQPPHTMAVVRTRLLFSGVCIVNALAAKHQAACFARATLQPVDMLSVRRKGGWLEANLPTSNHVLLCNTPGA